MLVDKGISKNSCLENFLSTNTGLENISLCYLFIAPINSI